LLTKQVNFQKAYALDVSIINNLDKAFRFRILAFSAFTKRDLNPLGHADSHQQVLLITRTFFSRLTIALHFHGQLSHNASCQKD